eukprot:scaffold1746_cov121-Isochrysis_galbana.AAC.9
MAPSHRDSMSLSRRAALCSARSFRLASNSTSFQCWSMAMVESSPRAIRCSDARASSATLRECSASVSVALARIARGADARQSAQPLPQNLHRDQFALLRAKCPCQARFAGLRVLLCRGASKAANARCLSVPVRAEQRELRTRALALPYTRVHLRLAFQVLRALPRQHQLHVLHLLLRVSAHIVRKTVPLTQRLDDLIGLNHVEPHQQNIALALRILFLGTTEHVLECRVHVLGVRISLLRLLEQMLQLLQPSDFTAHIGGSSNPVRASVGIYEQTLVEVAELAQLSLLGICLSSCKLHLSTQRDGSLIERSGVLSGKVLHKMADTSRRRLPLRGGRGHR